MKDRRDVKERLLNKTGTDNDTTLKHQITLQINGINTVLTEAKNFAVKQKLPTEELLTLENQVDVLKAVLKSLDKEIAAYDKEHEKAKDAQFQKEYLAEFIPVEFRPASVEEMDDFIIRARKTPTSRKA